MPTRGSQKPRIKAKTKTAPARSTTKPRVTAKKRNPIPKKVRSMMISKEQDAKNKARGVQSKGRASKAGVDSSVKSATDKAKSAIKSGASKLLRVGGAGLSAALASDKLGGGKDTMAGNESRRNAFVDKRTKQEADAKRAQAATKARKTFADKAKREKTEEATNQKKRAVQRAVLSTKPTAKSTSKTSSEPRSIAEAKRLGKSYFIGGDGKRKAAVTAEDLKKSGHKTLSAYLNAKGQPTKSDSSSTQKSAPSAKKSQVDTTNKARSASSTDDAYAKPKVTTIKKKDPETGIVREYQPRPGGKGFRNFNLKK